ncbi:MAG: hypothetical protein ABIV47_12620 [Roseiflexaceae bacterium]
MKQRRWMLAGIMILALAACGTPSVGQSPTSSGSAQEPSPTAIQQPEQSPTIVGSTEEPSPAADEEAALTNPLCNLATMPEVQAVVGGTITKIDVIDEATLDNLSCVYLDEHDYNNGLTIQFITTDRLVKSDSKWSTAAAYFAEWTRKGEPVARLGEGAAWVELTNGLYVLKGGTVLQLSASSADTKNPALRAKFETLAGQVLDRLT